MCPIAILLYCIIAALREHLNKFFAVDKLSKMEVMINSDLLTIMMPPNFENFQCAIESRDELPSPKTFRIKITEESKQLSNSH